jgi:N utilization substance protein B
MSRIAVVERNILRLAILELRRGEVPPKVVIDEAVRLAHWFGGARAPGFVNGVLDGIARATGRL